MIPRSMTFAAQLTRTWVAMYTAGLPEELSCTRRDEIESDLWEQDLAGDVTRGEALERLVLGMPADLSWRLEQQRLGTKEDDDTGRKRSMFEPTAQKAFIGGAWLMALFTVAIAGLVAFGGGEGEVLSVAVPRPVWGVVGVSAAVMILAGVRISNASPISGGACVLAGALPLAFILAWSVLAPVVWLLLAVLLVVRAFGHAREPNRPTAA